MGILITILTILDVLIAILIIALVLVQQSKSSGLGTTFGGGGSDSLFGAHAESHLSRLTVIFASLFLVITLALAILSAHQSKYRENMSNINPLLANSAPAQTAPAKPVSANTKAEADKPVISTDAKAVDKAASNSAAGSNTVQVKQETKPDNSK